MGVSETVALRWPAGITTRPLGSLRMKSMPGVAVPLRTNETTSSPAGSPERLMRNVPGLPSSAAAGSMAWTVTTVGSGLNLPGSCGGGTDGMVWSTVGRGDAAEPTPVAGLGVLPVTG